MPRSIKKGYFVDADLLKKVAAAKEGKTKGAIQTRRRRSTITPEMVGIKFAVHNGKDFIDVLVIEDMIGHKLGEFAPTTKFKGHGGKNAK